MLLSCCFRTHPKIPLQYNSQNLILSRSSWFKRKRVEPPIAKPCESFHKLPFTVTWNGKSTNVLQDNYAWLQDLSQKSVQEYLDSENKHTSSMRSRIHSKAMDLNREFLSIYQQIDRPTSVAERIGEYDYFTKNEKNKRFPLFCRRNALSGVSEVILDADKLFQQHEYMHIGMLKVSPGHEKLAFTLDTSGQETYTLFVKIIGSSLETQRIADDVVSFEWDHIGDTIFYTTCDSLKRSYRVWKCQLQRYTENPDLIFEENDPAFYVDIGRSKDQRFLTINCNTKRCSEVRVLDLHTNMPPVLIQPRQENLEYFVEHLQDSFIIVTNADNCPNYKIVKTSSKKLTMECLRTSAWETLIPYSPHTRIEDLDVFKVWSFKSSFISQNYLVVYERHEGCPRIRVISMTNTTESYLIDLPEKIVSIQPGINMNVESTTLRFTYSSMITPECTIDYCLETRTFKIVRHIQLSDLKIGLTRNDLSYHQLQVPSKDVSVPLTLLHRSSLKLDNKCVKNCLSQLTLRNPVLLVAYGAYGHTTETKFHTEYLPLVKRGWIVGLAHIRGGGELGAHWYEAGRQLKKKNSFTDFISCAEYLISNGYTSSSVMTAMTASAGGLLLGVVVNQRPDLFKALVMKVPFVDVTTSMLNDSLPLTKHEYDEWGNPTSQPEVLEYILSYDPYANIQPSQPKTFPNLLVTASTMDIRVPYWQPTKWVAKLRHAHSNNPKINEHIYLKIYDDSGHFGDSEGGNRDTVWECAIEYGFLLDSL